MEINIRNIEPSQKEYIEIGCHKVTDRINDIVRFVKLRQGSIDAFREDRQYQIPVSDILYVESVDDRTFIYLAGDCLESRRRLYEVEEMLPSQYFARISKSAVVNLMKITSVSPALNGRFLCLLRNGEKLMISRKYVPGIREKLKGESR